MPTIRQLSKGKMVTGSGKNPSSNNRVSSGRRRIMGAPKLRTTSMAPRLGTTVRPRRKKVY